MTNIRNALIQSAGSAGDDKVYVEDVFSTFLYAGTNTSTSHQIQNGIDLSGEGGLVWIKKRDSNVANANHYLTDTVRGNKYLASNSINGEATGSIASYNSDGFTFNASTGLSTDYLGSDYVSWTWRKQEGFFDCVTFSTTGGGGTQAVSHSLGSEPGLIIIKKTSDTQSWLVWKKDITQAQCHNGSTTWWRNYGVLNATSPFTDWGDTSGLASEPSSTAVTLGTYYTNATADYVMYVFAEGGSDDQIFGEDGDEAIIKTGTFTANTSVTLGWEPQWLLVKKTSGTEDWQICDNMRGTPTGGNDTFLVPNTDAADSTSYDGVSFTATGFTIQNMSGTFIYMAMRRGPMKEPSAGTDVFQAQAYTGDGSTRVFDLNITPDWTINTPRNIAGDARASNARLTGSGEEIYTNGNQGIYSAGAAGMQFDYTKQISVQNYRYTNTEPYINWHFKRYPKVFDMVINAGTGGANLVSHNLTVRPELIITKRTDTGEDWFTIAQNGGSASSWSVFYAGIQSNAARNEAAADYSLKVTATQYDTAIACANVSGGTYISYLFATLDGVSKVGNYTGTGNDLNVTGLGAAARFVMIKRTDNTGDWYVYDSTRGIVAGNDPYLFLNDNAVEVTSTDYIDPLASGFTVTSSAPAGLNASGGTYLYLAFS